MIALLVGLLAGTVSLGRLWLGSSQAPQEVLWAEDGLFALCIRKADFFTCLTEPYAGYFLLTPRVLAWPVAILSWEYWALASNILAAALAGVIAGLVVTITRRAGLNWFVSVAIAVLPVIAPMSGLEAINSVSSSYMLLIYASMIAIALPQSLSRSRTWRVGIGLLLLVTALTIPSAVVLVFVIILQGLRRATRTSLTIGWLLATVLGLVVQALFALSAVAPRQIDFSSETLDGWANSIPISLLTYWPGISIGEYSFFSNFTLSPLGITGWLLVAALLASGLILVVRGWSAPASRSTPAGLLTLAGLGLGLIPSAIGDPNNRYFVVPLALWGAALLLLLEPRITTTRPWLVAVAAVVVLVIWWPAIPASQYRSTPAPPWTGEVERIEAKCASDPAFTDRPIFSPFWPPNWGDGLIEPTHPNLPCLVVWRSEIE
jgi:hypothetical protein